MTDDQDTAETTPARPVRVPNVSPHAKSGLDHTVIGSAAIDAYDSEYGAPEEPAVSIEVPSGTDEERLAWVADGETHQDRSDRASAIYQHALDSGGEEEDTLGDLRGGLVAAVYGTTEEESLPEIPEDVADTVDALSVWVGEAEDADEQKARAKAVLARENERLEPRVTLVEPLQAIVDTPPAEDPPAGD